MNVTVACTQMACSWDLAENLDRAERLVKKAADQGAQIVLLQELFATPYFCIDVQERHFDLAQPLQGNPLIERFQKLAQAARAGAARFRFSSKPDRPTTTRWRSSTRTAALPGITARATSRSFRRYEEKYYFSPGDTGFLAIDTRYGRIGVAICWDQWFPEAARAMALAGAEILFYPTAIGSEVYPARPRQQGSLAERHARPRGGQRHAGGGVEPDRDGAAAATSRWRSTARRSSPITWAMRSSRRTARPNPC